METFGIASVAVITVITYLVGLVGKASSMNGKAKGCARRRRKKRALIKFISSFGASSGSSVTKRNGVRAEVEQSMRRTMAPGAQFST